MRQRLISTTLRRTLLFIALLGAALPVGAVPPPPVTSASIRAAPLFQTMLPLIQISDSFGSTPALWAHAEPPAPHEVSLLRCTIALSAPLTAARLELFADTRYVAWLNGAPLGRGPARFSQMRREYDPYSLGSLGSGVHTLAVLAQWAPNQRRSESVAPELRGRLLAQQGATSFRLSLSPAVCRGLRSLAWQSSPALVHSWGLLGPSELLDLRALPAGWSKPGFDDTAWPAAALRQSGAPLAHYQERSIAPLTQLPVAPRLAAAGRLAPDAWVGELVANGAGEASYSFTLNAPGTVALQTLAMVGALVTLDGALVHWLPLPNAHPDRYGATLQLAAGRHTLHVRGLAPGDTWVFSIGRAGLAGPPPELGAGRHAGQRLLMPDLRADAGVARLGADGVLRFTGGPAYAILDLGRVVQGRLSFVAADAAGTLVDIGWDERLSPWGYPLPYPGSLHPEWNQSDSWRLADVDQTVTTIDARAGRYVLVAVWSDGPLALRNVQVTEERYPLLQRGSFRSGDPLLDRVWQVGVDTLYPNMNDAYADPWRERGQWWGDAHIADRASQVVFGELALLRRGLGQIADAQVNGQLPALAPNGAGTYLIDYGIYWVQSLYDYGVRSGDWAFVAKHYPQLQAFIAYLETLADPQSGLIDMARAAPARIYVDSSSYWDRLGQTTAASAFVYAGLRSAATIATQLGHHGSAKLWRERAATLRARANQVFYMKAEGQYIAGIWNGVPSPTTPQAQAAALAFGLAPTDEEQRVADALLASLGTPAQPGVQILGMYLVLQGLGRVGRVDDGLAVIRRFYGSMLGRGATTWWEHFGADQRYAASLSHAWGSSPTWFLSTYMLGARPRGPDRWELVLPETAHPFATGRLPLASGELIVTWLSSCGAMDVRLTSPTGSAGLVYLPEWARDAVVRMNGVPTAPAVQALSEHLGAPMLRLQAGTYHIELARPSEGSGACRK